MNVSEKAETSKAGEHTRGEKPKGANSIVGRWEQKVGVKRDNPNFRVLVEDALSGEDEKTANATLMMLGLIDLPPKRVIPLERDAVPDWLKRED